MCLIFRVFADKETLLDACVMEALSPAHALDELALVSMDQPLVARTSGCRTPSQLIWSGCSAFRMPSSWKCQTTAIGESSKAAADASGHQCNKSQDT
ncbi:hypothetical protein QF034_000227 [Streptomyces africanus]|uniref:Uncharacterized protein n=1 Tax=Streptomyces africanus TaxID=231024 RepID=A0ABU0QF27_9ACTN|nr:hypothetical protein [Streptomyces africanus]